MLFDDQPIKLWIRTIHEKQHILVKSVKHAALLANKGNSPNELTRILKGMTNQDVGPKTDSDTNVTDDREMVNDFVNLEK